MQELERQRQKEQNKIGKKKEFYDDLKREYESRRLPQIKGN